MTTPSGINPGERAEAPRDSVRPGLHNAAGSRYDHDPRVKADGSGGYTDADQDGARSATAGRPDGLDPDGRIEPHPVARAVVEQQLREASDPQARDARIARGKSIWSQLSEKAIAERRRGSSDTNQSGPADVQIAGEDRSLPDSTVDANAGEAKGRPDRPGPTVWPQKMADSAQPGDFLFPDRGHGGGSYERNPDGGWDFLPFGSDERIPLVQVVETDRSCLTATADGPDEQAAEADQAEHGDAETAAAVAEDQAEAQPVESDAVAARAGQCGEAGNDDADGW